MSKCPYVHMSTCPHGHMDIIDIWGYKDIRTIVVVIVGEFFPIICFVCVIPIVVISFVPLYLLSLYFLSLYTFCHYTLCHMIPFVFKHFVF
jgi:hypothetical protein